MANGEEDLKEKNKGRDVFVVGHRYSKWSSSYGEEDAEMLMEKAGDRSGAKKKGKSKWIDES